MDIKNRITIIFSICIIFLFSYSVIDSENAYADQSGDYVYELSETGAVITSYMGNEALLSIPSSLDGFPVTVIGDFAFTENPNITTVIIPETVTSIGQLAFYQCNGLTQIKIGSNVTWIGDMAFASCPNLMSATFYGDAPELQFGVDTFYGCSYKFIIFYLYDKEGFTDPWNSYTTVPIALYKNLAEITILQRPFKTDYQVGEDLDLSGLVVEGIYKFDPNQYIPIAMDNISGFDSSVPSSDQIVTVSFISHTVAFTVNILGSPIDFNYIVNNDGVSATITNWNSEDEYLSVPASVDGYTITGIGPFAFINCSNVQYIDLPSSIANLSPMSFLGCSNLLGIFVDVENSQYSSLDGVLYNSFGELVSCPSAIPLEAFNVPDGVTGIGTFAFGGCNNIATITIPASVTNIEPLAFAPCESLTSIVVSTQNTVYSSDYGILFNKNQDAIYCYPNGIAYLWHDPTETIRILS